MKLHLPKLLLTAVISAMVCFSQTWGAEYVAVKGTTNYFHSCTITPVDSSVTAEFTGDNAWKNFSNTGNTERDHTLKFAADQLTSDIYYTIQYGNFNAGAIVVDENSHVKGINWDNADDASSNDKKRTFQIGKADGTYTSTFGRDFDIVPGEALNIKGIQTWNIDGEAKVGLVATTVTNSGALTLSGGTVEVQGSLVNTDTINVNGILVISSAISNTGSVVFGESGKMVVSSNMVAANKTEIDYAGDAGTLQDFVSTYTIYTGTGTVQGAKLYYGSSDGKAMVLNNDGTATKTDKFQIVLDTVTVGGESSAGVLEGAEGFAVGDTGVLNIAGAYGEMSAGMILDSLQGTSEGTVNVNVDASMSRATQFGGKLNVKDGITLTVNSVDYISTATTTVGGFLKLNTTLGGADGAGVLYQIANNSKLQTTGDGYIQLALGTGEGTELRLHNNKPGTTNDKIGNLTLNKRVEFTNEDGVMMHSGGSGFTLTIAENGALKSNVVSAVSKTSVLVNGGDLIAGSMALGHTTTDCGHRGVLQMDAGNLQTGTINFRRAANGTTDDTIRNKVVINGGTLEFTSANAFNFVYGEKTDHTALISIGGTGENTVTLKATKVDWTLDGGELSADRNIKNVTIAADNTKKVTLKNINLAGSITNNAQLELGNGVKVAANTTVAVSGTGTTDISGTFTNEGELQMAKVAATTDVTVAGNGKTSFADLTLTGGSLNVAGTLTLNALSVDFSKYSTDDSHTLVSSGSTLTLNGVDLQAITGVNGDYIANVEQVNESLVLFYLPATVTTEVESYTLDATGTALTLNVKEAVLREGMQVNVHLITDAMMRDILQEMQAKGAIKDDSNPMVSITLAGSVSGTITADTMDEVVFIKGDTGQNYWGEMVDGVGLQYNVARIPEPASATLSLAALMMLCARRRRRA